MIIKKNKKCNITINDKEINTIGGGFDIPQFKCFREQNIIIDTMSFNDGCLYYAFIKRYKNSNITGEIMIPIDGNNYNEDDIKKIMQESLGNLYDIKK